MKNITEYIKEAIDPKNNYSFTFGFRVSYEGNFDAYQEWKKKFMSECGTEIESDGDDDYTYLIIKSNKESDSKTAWKYITDMSASTHGEGGAFVQYTDSKKHEVDINIDYIKNHKRI